MKFFGQKEWVHLQLSVYELNVFLDVEFILNIDLKTKKPDSFETVFTMQKLMNSRCRCPLCFVH